LENVRRRSTNTNHVLRRREPASHSMTAITDATYHNTKATSARSSPMRNMG
jgi:hypothetical protein